MDRQELISGRALEAFASREFDLKIWPMASAALTRELIRKSEEFDHARRAMDAGLLTEQTVRKFVSTILHSFSRGERFRYETALAALAVLCESYFARFAEELLIDLAALRAPEVMHAVQVARQCLQHRMRLPRTKAKTFSVAKSFSSSDVEIRQSNRAWIANRRPTGSRAYAIA